MHGSSSVPQDLLDEIRKYGGNMKETYGVPVEEIQEAIKHGVRKINIDTDIRLAMTGAIRKYLAENPEKFDPRDYLKPAREAAKAICKQRYHAVRLRRPGGEDQGRSRCARSPSATRSGELAQTGRFERRSQAPPREPRRCCESSPAQSLPLLARGKVRDNYAVGDDRMLMVASDRLQRLRRRHGRADPRQGRAADARWRCSGSTSSATSCRTT